MNTILLHHGAMMTLNILNSATFQRYLARLSTRYFPRILKLGRSSFIFRWDDVADVLRRDDDFRIEPINKKRIDSVSGPFILGMDRNPEYFSQFSSGYSAMASLDWVALESSIQAETQRFISEAQAQVNDKAIDVTGTIIRPVATQTAKRIFGLTPKDDHAFAETIRAVFQETFLNLGDNMDIHKAGAHAGKNLTQWTLDEIEKRRKENALGHDFLGQLLSNNSDLSGQEITNISNGYLVGSIDTTTTTVTHILYEIISNPSLLANVKKDMDNPKRFLGWIMEVLRRRPHNPVVLRQAAHNTVLAGKPIKAGQRIFAVTLAAMQDRSVFINPVLMDPTRQFDRYMHFGFGPHICAGRDVNFIQIPILVKAILKQNPISVKKFKSAGPFPNQMIITFEGADNA